MTEIKTPGPQLDQDCKVAYDGKSMSRNIQAGYRLQVNAWFQMVTAMEWTGTENEDAISWTEAVDLAVALMSAAGTLKLPCQFKWKNAFGAAMG